MNTDDQLKELSHTQRLKAAVHYNVGNLCREVADEQEIQISKQAIAAISEITFRQFETFAKDLEMFARHAKRTTINMDDVKLLARRSRSLYAHITKCGDEIASNNLEQKEKKKKFANAGKGPKHSEGDPLNPDTEDKSVV
ncbi:centromere protein S [Rhinophrynus dorsalis]